MIRTIVGWWRERPGWCEWLFLPIVALMCLLTVIDLVVDSPTRSWLDYYYANPGIIVLLGGAAVLDLACALTVLVWMIIPRWRAACLKLLLTAALIGPALIRAELLYERTIYYGEVRDKRNLLCDLHNLGPIGSEIFLAYFLLRVPLGGTNTPANLLARTVVRVALLLASHVGHQLLYWPQKEIAMWRWHSCY